MINISSNLQFNQTSPPTVENIPIAIDSLFVVNDTAEQADVHEFLKAEFSLADALKLINNNISCNTACEWALCGFDTYEIITWLKNGLDLEKAKIWSKYFSYHYDMASLAALDPSEAFEWPKSPYSPINSLKFIKNNISAENATKLYKYMYDYHNCDELIRLFNRNCKLNTVVKVFEWLKAGFKLEDIELLSKNNISVENAINKTKEGFTIYEIATNLTKNKKASTNIDITQYRVNSGWWVKNYLPTS
jgi:hypothetical protein